MKIRVVLALVSACAGLGIVPTSALATEVGCSMPAMQLAGSSAIHARSAGGAGCPLQPDMLAHNFGSAWTPVQSVSITGSATTPAYIWNSARRAWDRMPSQTIVDYNLTRDRVMVYQGSWSSKWILAWGTNIALGNGETGTRYFAIPRIASHRIAPSSCADARKMTADPDLICLVPLLRYYASAVTDHYYCTQAGVFTSVCHTAPYRSEGSDGWLSLDSAGGTARRLYRVRKVKLGGAEIADEDTLLTTSSAEVTSARNLGYTHLPTATIGYVRSTDDLNTKALYRLWHVGGTDHFYTTSIAERSRAITEIGFGSEGVAGYVWHSPDIRFVAHTA